MILLLDNFDSFTYNLVDYFEQLGEECVVVRNNIPPETLNIEEFSCLILSPGPGRPESAGYLTGYIQLFKDRIPILGICLGHQAIGEYFGLQLIKASKPMHGKVSRVRKITDDQLFRDMPNQWQVVRYHSLVIEGFQNSPLKPIAESKEGENMIFKHHFLPIYGIQFHPEAALTSYGLEILANWLRLLKNKNDAIAV